MPKTKERPETLAKKAKVRAATDLRGVPKGTDGRVMMVSGLTWQRYWVRFDNGVEVGSLHRDKLVRSEEWDRWLVEESDRAERAAQEAERRASAPAASEADGGDAGDAPAAGGLASKVPAHLLERSKLARQRLGAG